MNLNPFRRGEESSEPVENSHEIAYREYLETMSDAIVEGARERGLNARGARDYASEILYAMHENGEYDDEEIIAIRNGVFNKLLGRRQK